MTIEVIEDDILKKSPKPSSNVGKQGGLAKNRIV